MNKKRRFPLKLFWAHSLLVPHRPLLSLPFLFPPKLSAKHLCSTIPLLEDRSSTPLSCDTFRASWILQALHVKQTNLKIWCCKSLMREKWHLSFWSGLPHSESITHFNAKEVYFELSQHSWDHFLFQTVNTLIESFVKICCS